MSVTLEDRNAATRLAIQQSRKDLLAFIMLMNPSFSVGPHHRLLCDQLMRIEAGKVDRLMVFVAPRSSKSLSSIYVFSSMGAWAQSILAGNCCLT